ncbi:hypothetical protein AMTRI_Chr13g90960 [Amborella trichopoda]
MLYPLSLSYLLNSTETLPSFEFQSSSLACSNGMLCDYKFPFGFDIFNPITLDSMGMEKTFEFKSNFIFGFYYNPVSTAFYILKYTLLVPILIKHWNVDPIHIKHWKVPGRPQHPLTPFYSILTCVLGKFYNVFCAEEYGGEEWEESLPLPTGIPRPDNSDFGFRFLEWEGQICFVHGWFHEGDRKECGMGIWALTEMGLGKKLKSFYKVLWISKRR